MGSSEAIADGLWRFALRTPTLPPATSTNTLLLEGRDALAVIEPGCPYQQENEPLYAAIEARRDAGKALEWIVCTHQHVDHVGGATALQQRFGGRIVVHPETANRLTMPADVLVREGDVLDLGGNTTIEFVFTPGHAPGHLMVWLAAQRVVHAGDLVASEGTILVDLRDGGNMATYLDSLRRMAARFAGEWSDVRLVPAHGDVVEQPEALCEFYVAHRLAREQRVLDALGARPLTIDELLPLAYADKPANILPLARFALDAHVDKLLQEQRVTWVDQRLQVTEA